MEKRHVVVEDYEHYQNRTAGTKFALIMGGIIGIAFGLYFYFEREIFQLDSDIVLVILLFGLFSFFLGIKSK
jgi:hypothetical protein